MISKQIQIKLLYELENLHHVVVQATSVDHNSVFALQLLHGQTDTIVYQASANHKHVSFNEAAPILYLDGVKAGGKAGGHTQTWVHAGRANYYFVGVKPKKYGSHYWDSQIARVHLTDESLHFHDNTEMTRLSYMNRAGYGWGNNEVPYPGKELERLEAAVSPNGHKMLIASIDKQHVGHFSLYDLNEVNEKLDQAGTQDLNIQTLHCLGAFNISNFNTDPLHSIQGYALDNQDNVYISSQPGPKANILGFAKPGSPREIVKIPWGISDADQWEVADLDQDKTVDSFGYVTEFEGIQAIDDQILYLTIAYHRKSDMTTLKNRIYQIDWK